MKSLTSAICAITVVQVPVFCKRTIDYILVKNLTSATYVTMLAQQPVLCSGTNEHTLAKEPYKCDHCSKIFAGSSDGSRHHKLHEILTKVSRSNSSPNNSSRHFLTRKKSRTIGIGSTELHFNNAKTSKGQNNRHAPIFICMLEAPNGAVFF